MPRPKREPTSSRQDDVAPVYRHLHDQALAMIAAYDDPIRREAHAQVITEGLARPLDDLLRPHRDRVKACAGRGPITVGRWEISHWFSALPEEMWSFTLNPDGTLAIA